MIDIRRINRTHVATDRASAGTMIDIASYRSRFRRYHWCVRRHHSRFRRHHARFHRNRDRYPAISIALPSNHSPILRKHDRYPRISIVLPPRPRSMSRISVDLPRQPFGLLLQA
jgi:hypothetical protein